MIKCKQIICHNLKLILITFLLLLIAQSCNNRVSVDNVPLKKNESSEFSNSNKKEIKNGEWISYFPNGEIQSVCHFKDGVPDGSIIVYNEGGQELYRGNFENGAKIGEWVFTNPETNEIIKKDY
tara:strand:+ start:26965 stop:27336 length:372 start_codon:yes stop_codon:yes gene_type:complete